MKLRAEIGHRGRRVGPAALVAVASLLSAGCRQDMHDQAKYEPLEASELFADGTSARPPVPGTVARGLLRDDRAVFTGRTSEDQFVGELPVELDRSLLERGRSRYEAFCSPCHGRTGDGQGMVVQRGFKRPQSFHQSRLRESPVGYFFDVMTNGFGQMSSYASQIDAADRWAIAAYVKTLQLSRYAPVEMLSADDLERIAAATKTLEQGVQDE